MIEENMKQVRENMKQACLRAGRDPNEITLIAVSKTKPISMIQEALLTNIKDFGENKVQELMEKQELLTKDIRWHMIGHLQRNKVKNVVGKVCLIHSVDSLELAYKVEEEAKKSNVVCPILIEVNMAEEETKFGVRRNDVLPLILKISKLPNIQIKGLMTVAPFVENPEENRMCFRNLNQLKIDIKSKNIDNTNMDILSMGMTSDYEVAIEEGSTMVRVGTGIFGERKYNME